jgi:hypothetical protein
MAVTGVFPSALETDSLMWQGQERVVSSLAMRVVALQLFAWL